VTFGRSVALLPLIPLVLAACADGGGESGRSGPAALEGTEWVLDQASMASLVDHVPADAEVTIGFSNGRVQGRAACNSYGGGYQARDDGSISFEGFAVTMMACDEPLMALERAYLPTLADVSAFTMDRTLVLSGNGVELTYRPQASPEPLPLVGTAWRLTSIASGTAVSSTVAGSEITAGFDADGTASGSAGCNRYHATYTTSDGSLSFGPFATTKMMCPDDVMTQEQAFLTAMGEVAGYSIDGSTLTLVDGAGAMLLDFEGTA
jgi:heat shock protein HslJ